MKGPGRLHQVLKPVRLCVRVKIIHHMADHAFSITEQQRPPGHLRFLVQNAVLPADSPVPVGRQREREAGVRGVKDPKRRQVVDRNSDRLYPQTLEVLVMLGEQHKLRGSDGREGEGVEGEQKRLALQAVKGSLSLG